MKTFRTIIPFSAAAATVTLLNVIVIAFHILVMTKVIPFDMVWGGRLQSVNEMYLFESVSIGVNALLIGIVQLKKKAVQNARRHNVINFILWIYIALFLLNTVGNLVAIQTIETLIATPLTLLLSILCLRLAIER